MRQIKVIKLTSFLLFILPLFTLLFILSTVNHLISYSPIYFPNGIQKHQKFKCNESNNLCRNIPLKKIKLTECSLKKIKHIYRKNGVVINPSMEMVAQDFWDIKKNQNDQYE